jgi:hypothetical protein
MAMIATTIISSIRVNPLERLIIGLLGSCPIGFPATAVPPRPTP